jgi:hypothetical protein
MAIENIENGGLQIYWENITLFSNEFSLQLNKLHVKIGLSPGQV